VDNRTTRRLRWFVPLGLATTLALGWAVGPVSAYLSARPMPSPAFAADDGLPAELVSGAKYTARFTITLPADWPVQEKSAGGSYALLTMIARGRPLDDPPEKPELPGVLYCSHGYDDAAGTTVTMDCPLFAPDPGPWDLYVHADTPHVYHHTVVAKP
jgi:hypothetical protein